MQCHCTYLDPEFWHSNDPCVMCNTYSSGEAEEFERWLEQQGDPRLKGHVFFQTSGSTGKAKWVALSKEALLASARAVNDHLGIELGAKWALCLPIFHVGGFGVIVRSFLAGGHCQVFHAKWDAVAFTKFVYEQKSEYMSLVPTQLVDLVRARCVAPDSVKAVIVGGGKLENADFQEAKALGWPVLRSYGMTEAASQIATGDDEERGMCLLPIWEVRTTEDGLLEWRGEAGFSYYLEASDDGFFLVDPKCDGWFQTQDRVQIEGQHLRMLGRNDALVKVLGELVDLSVIEQNLSEYTSLQCVLFPVPDSRRGVKLIPVVESDAAVVLPEFNGLERLENARFVAEFPRSSLGKVQRQKLRDQLGI